MSSHKFRGKVGHSDRTPAKHAAFNCVVGKEIGSLPFCAARLRAPLKRIVLVDQTAGDGNPYHSEGPWHRSTSPGIFAHHATHRYRSVAVPIEVILYELKTHTFEVLLSRLSEELPQIRRDDIIGSGCCYEQTGDKTWISVDGLVTVRAIKGDSRQHDFSSYGLGDWMFLNNDPNTLAGWSLNNPTIKSAIIKGARARSFSTLGCNPGGLKRLPRTDRQAWWDNAADLAITARMLGTLDIVLIAIKNDDAQWAYMIVLPAVWANDDIETVSREFTKRGLQVEAYSLLRNRVDYDKLLNRLFSTKSELEAV